MRLLHLIGLIAAFFVLSGCARPVVETPPSASLTPVSGQETTAPSIPALPPPTPPASAPTESPLATAPPPRPIQQPPDRLIPAGQDSEVWQSLRIEGGFAAVVKGRFADAEVLTLPYGRFRLYVEDMDTHNIVSLISPDGLSWTMESGSRVGNAAFPDAVRLSDGRVRLYFQRAMTIHSAISNDDGLTFVEEPGVRILTGWHDGLDRDNVGASTTVRLPDGRFRMYYRAGVTDAAYFNGTKTVIVSAISNDGLSWTAEPGVRIDAKDWVNPGPTNVRYVDGPEVVLTDTGRFKLYFWGVAIGNGVSLAESDDGLVFKQIQHVFPSRDTPDGTQPGDPTILALPDKPWLMYFGVGPANPQFYGIWIARLEKPAR